MADSVRPAAWSDVIYPRVTASHKLSSTGDNYLIWKLKISFVLRDHGLDNLLLTDPNPTDPKWVKDDKTARVDLILPTLDELLISRYFLEHDSTKSLMDSLESSFNSTSLLHKWNLLMRYRTHHMAPGTPINKHIFQMRALAKELDYAGAKFPDEFHVGTLLDSFPEDWREDIERLILDLDFSKDGFNFDNVGRRLRAVGDIRKLRAFEKGFYCGSKGHQKSEKASWTEEVEILDYVSLSPSQHDYFFFKIKHKLDSTGHEFCFWEPKLQHFFKKNKFVHVFCDQKPADGDPKQTKWLADDLLCRHLILGALDDELFLSFHDYPTAKSLMDAVKMFFKSSAPDRLLRLKKYMDHQMLEDTPIWDHIQKMEQLAWKSHRSGITIPDEMKAIALLKSLPDSLGDLMIPATVTMDNEKVNLLHIRDIILHIGGSMEREKAVETSNNHYGHGYRKRRRGSCYACGRTGHYKSDCPNRGM